MSSKLKQLVYISSSTSSDLAWVRDLADALSHHGFQPWLDEFKLVPGVPWQNKLEEALRESEAILFVLTGDSQERINVFFELGFAKALGKQSIFIVPRNQDVSWIPYDLRDEEIVVRKSPDATAAALVAALRPGQSSVLKTLDLSSTEKKLQFEAIEFLDQYPRFPCVLLLDSSGSMAGKPIEELNRAISAFTQTLAQDELASRRTELTIISFGSQVRILQDFTSPGETQNLQLEASGATSMGKAIQTGLDMLDRRRTVYKANGITYFKPLMVLITDGSPTDTWEEAAQRVRQGAAAKHFSFFTIAVENADMEILTRIAPTSIPPRRLRELDFDRFFLWLSSSISRVTSSQPGENIKLPPPDWSVDI